MADLYFKPNVSITRGPLMIRSISCDHDGGVLQVRDVR